MRAVAGKALQLGKNTEMLTGLLDVAGEGKKKVWHKYTNTPGKEFIRERKQKWSCLAQKATEHYQVEWCYLIAVHLSAKDKLSEA
ncbi:hypothetical protein NC652_004514 [Populus alba x Populus x berolinensis]|uniref:Uncharacterized protein n=1 Tax=Populus alba x Populus x berolinensis TaxID=444605 RepID=A0AAD6RWQ1_9ROSI|nr:hypothetical protein NC652_004514 [Populus alba x Populus x berolinensis]KAJ7015177.1 hypothetical protein NC653_004477 [Populus alba x Populus x berolinensis]